MLHRLCDVMSEYYEFDVIFDFIVNLFSRDDIRNGSENEKENRANACPELHCKGTIATDRMKQLALFILLMNV